RLEELVRVRIRRRHELPSISRDIGLAGGKNPALQDLDELRHLIALQRLRPALLRRVDAVSADTLEHRPQNALVGLLAGDEALEELQLRLGGRLRRGNAP